MKNKILLITNRIMPYRVKLFELLNEKYDLTIGYSEGNYSEFTFCFKIIHLPVRKIGPFELHTNDLHNIGQNFDVVIGISNIRWLSLVLLAFKKKRSYKLGYWGIGVSASYEKKFDANSKWDKLRFLISKKSDFTIFYSSYPLEKYINAGISENKLFVVNNTTFVELEENIDYSKKKNYLFIGTLYPQKGIYDLLKAYLYNFEKNENIPELHIVGDGTEKGSIQDFINKNNIRHKVILHGSIFDDKSLFEIFSSALICISPNQAGLSVLTSMGNHTAFVTKKSAITGGEIFNIKNYYNGILYEHENELRDLLEWINFNKEKVIQLNKNAYLYYSKNRTIDIMSNELFNALIEIEKK